jgi:hypothetical protein
MSDPYRFGGPVTAVCPGCNAVVVLPAEPLFEDTPPAICSTCESEVPDYRRPSFTMPDTLGPPTTEPTLPVEEPRPENQRVTRGGLFRSLTGLVADRGLSAIEQARDRSGF